MSKVSIVYPIGIDKISPNIYGHFAEHLGGVIYDGIYVGKGAQHPQYIRAFLQKIRFVLKVT